MCVCVLYSSALPPTHSSLTFKIELFITVSLSLVPDSLFGFLGGFFPQPPGYHCAISKSAHTPAEKQTKKKPFYSHLPYKTHLLVPTHFSFVASSFHCYFIHLGVFQRFELTKNIEHRQCNLLKYCFFFLQRFRKRTLTEHTVCLNTVRRYYLSLAIFLNPIQRT